MNSILVADDEKSLRDFLVIMLKEEGYQVVTASSVEKAIKQIHENEFDLILTDIRMGRSSGIDVLDAAKDTLPDTPVVMMTAYASAETAVIAMKKGAYDYISKPFKIEDIQLIIKNALDKRRLTAENRLLKNTLNDHFQVSNVIGKFESIKKIFDLVDKVSQSKATVLITGESGTGKELIAKAIHFNGNRKNYPFHLPPLRERKEDITELVNHFINKYNARHNKTYIQGIDPDALKVFERHSWPGNVR
ncbi:MAG: sigma-54-dependent Fis family transcriptional regulator [Nitrospinae bacterium]|nr:sigma-54-dependent Fis family transcriptional regulator [Nitrospinota bacterium]